MLAQRVLVSLVLLPLGLGAIYYGGTFYFLLIALILGIAGWEFNRLFTSQKNRFSGYLTVAGILALVGARHFAGENGNPMGGDSLVISGVILLMMTAHLIAFERGLPRAGSDFAIAVAGFIYIGFLGGYLIPLRNLPDGQWWVLVVLPAVWIADSGAYLIGSRFGRHKLSPNLSPKKTWEGYLAGVVTGPLGAALLSLGWIALGGPGIAITPLRSAALGLVLAILTPLGDLGESMFKRQVGVKDSSHLLPGHGGALDRIDSWIWAAVIGFYFINWFYY